MTTVQPIRARQGTPKRRGESGVGLVFRSANESKRPPPINALPKRAKTTHLTAQSTKEIAKPMISDRLMNYMPLSKRQNDWNTGAFIRTQPNRTPNFQPASTPLPSFVQKQWVRGQRPHVEPLGGDPWLVGYRREAPSFIQENTPMPFTLNPFRPDDASGMIAGDYVVSVNQSDQRTSEAADAPFRSAQVASEMRPVQEEAAVQPDPVAPPSHPIDTEGAGKARAMFLGSGAVRAERPVRETVTETDRAQKQIVLGNRFTNEADPSEDPVDDPVSIGGPFETPTGGKSSLLSSKTPTVDRLLHTCAFPCMDPFAISTGVRYEDSNRPHAAVLPTAIGPEQFVPLDQMVDTVTHDPRQDKDKPVDLDPAPGARKDGEASAALDARIEHDVQSRRLYQYGVRS